MIRVSGAFVTRWQEEMEIASRLAKGSPRFGGSYGDEHRKVEYFLEAMKYELAKVIFPEVANAEYHPPKAQASAGPREQA